jgi:hypothetical protein
MRRRVDTAWRTVVTVSEDGVFTSEGRQCVPELDYYILDPTSVWEGQRRQAAEKDQHWNILYVVALDSHDHAVCRLVNRRYDSTLERFAISWIQQAYPDVVWPEPEKDTLQIACARVASKLITDSSGNRATALLLMKEDASMGEMWGAARLGDWLYRWLKDPEAKPSGPREEQDHDHD